MNPIAWVASMPHELAVFLLSMIPVTELRAAIPIGIEVYRLPWWEVGCIAIIGNIIPAFFILWIIPKIYDWLLKQPIIGNLLIRRIEKVRVSFGEKYSKYGAIALIIFIGIPLPMTGAWTGSLVAFLFNIPFKKSIFYIFLGVCIAATVVIPITLFAGGALRWLIS